VVADFNEAFLAKVNAIHGTDWKHHHVTDYGYGPLGLGREAVYRYFDEMIADGCYATLSALPQHDLVNMLPGNVRLVTSRLASTQDQTLEWLAAHGIFRWESLTFVVGPKSQLGGFDYFIEDCLANVIDLSPVVRERIFLIDHPYNQCDDLPENVTRVKDWTEILALMGRDFQRQKALTAADNSGIMEE
jgi:hypothetical protein